MDRRHKTNVRVTGTESIVGIETGAHKMARDRDRELTKRNSQEIVKDTTNVKAKMGETVCYLNIK